MAAGGRVYRVPMNQLAFSSSVQEFFAVTASSTIPLQLEEIRIDPFVTAATTFLLSLSLFTGSFTAGSGGTTVTPAKNNPNDAAAGATAKTGNTTRTAVGTGTKLQLDAGQMEAINGWVWQPLDIDHRIIVPVSGCIALSCDTTGVTDTVNGCLIFRELY